MKFKSKTTLLRDKLANECIGSRSNYLWFGTSQHKGKPIAWASADKSADPVNRWNKRIACGKKNVSRKTPSPFKVDAFKIINLLGEIHYLPDPVEITITSKKIKVYLDNENYIQEVLA